MSDTFSFEVLRRYPDLEADNLVAVDATDRLVLAEATVAIETAAAGRVVVIGDRYGAITLGAIALHGAREVRVHQDLLSGEQALAHNAMRAELGSDSAQLGTGPAELMGAGLVGTGLAGTGPDLAAGRARPAFGFRQLPLTEELFTGATVVIGQLPKSLEALREISQLAAAHADPAVTMLLGGRVKHMTRAMNDVLHDSFADVTASLARQKSRVLVAGGPRPAGRSEATAYPMRQHHRDLDLWVCAHGAAFGGTKIDLGTRFLLGFLDRMQPAAETAVDLGCGTGVIATTLARSRPQLEILATDESTAAVRSAVATLAANGLAGAVRVFRDNAMSTLADASVDLVVCNPPFHLGTSVHTGASARLFQSAGRVLRPGGQLWTVFNSQLLYRGQLTRAVGPTRVIGRNNKFTVTQSTR